MTYGIVGTCSSSYIWPTIDCAFVRLNEYYNTQQKLFVNGTAYTPAGMDYSFYTGENYCKWGYGDGVAYVTFGTCINKSYSLVGVDDIHVDHTVGLFDFDANHGDSGGTITRSLSDGTYRIGGIVRGGLIFGDSQKYSIGESLGQVVDKLGVVPVSQDVIKGDVNNDGKICVRDVRLALRHVEGKEYLAPYPYMLADVNCNGTVTQTDVDKILAMSVGK